MKAARNAVVLWTIPAVYLLFVGGEFLAMTQLALSLTAGGASALRVGIVGSAMWLGIFAASTRSHSVVARHGHPRTFVVATGAAALALLSLTLHQSYGLWVAGVVALGLAGGLVWVAGESWLAEVAPAARRGFYVGMFETSVGVGMLIGPALIPPSMALGLDPLWVAVAMLAAAFAGSLLLWRVPGPALHTHSEGESATGDSVAPAWRAVAMPLALVAAVAGVMESGVSAMLPSISMRLGFPIQSAAWLGAVIGAGSALLQTPFGLLADRAGLGRAMALAWALVLAAAAALLIGAERPEQVLWVCGFVLGGVGGSIYTLVVIELGHRLNGAGLLRAMGLLVSAYTLGTAGGPVSGGWLFDRYGLRGLAATLLGFAVLGAALAWRAGQGRLTPLAAATRSSVNR
jgi:MFS family permease